MFKDFEVKRISKDDSSTCKFIKKETLAQVFSCGLCDIFKNTYFIEHLRKTASVQGISLNVISHVKLM